MRVLFVAPYPLSRIRSRSYGFVTHILKEHQVTVLALCSTRREADDVQALRDEGIDIVAIHDKRREKIIRVLGSCGTQIPFQVAYDASPRLKEAITTHVQTGHYDIVHVEFIRALGALPDDLSIPVVWDAVDCISQLYEQGASFGATAMMRSIGHAEAQRTSAYERKQMYRFRSILVTSTRDRQAFLNLLQNDRQAPIEKRYAEIVALPHGVNRHYFHYYTGPRNKETIIFSGKMSFHANIAGVHHFVEHILPLIWKERPHVQCVIAGSSPPASIRRLSRDPRIVVTGYVEDIRPYIAQAYVAVCPLPYAVGIQNKVLEAMAMGTPVVASSHAVGGLIEPVIGEDVFVADEPYVFADTVLRLLNDQHLWNTTSQNGVNYVTEKYDWDCVTQQLINIYTKALSHNENGLVEVR